MAKNANRVSAKEQKPTCTSGASHEEIQKKAYHIWEAEGKPSGKDWDMWLKAEKEVCAAVKK
jgi:hypothetical protein